MDIYFSRQSLSHFKVDEDNHQIIIYLVNGENLIVDATYEHLMKWTDILRKMLKEYESYTDVVRYDTSNRKLYFRIMPASFYMRPTPIFKFNIGDTIRDKRGFLPSFTIDRIVGMDYIGENGEQVGLAMQDDWELVEGPKFKVGDKIRFLKDCGTVMTIDRIKDGMYIFANNMGHVPIEEGNTWSLVEECQSKPTDRFAFKALPRLLEMLEPNDRAKEYTRKLIDQLEKEGYITDAKIIMECLNMMEGEKVPMATMD